MPQSITVIGREELISQENLQFDALTFPVLSSEQAYNENKTLGHCHIHWATYYRQTYRPFVQEVHWTLHATVIKNASNNKYQKFWRERTTSLFEVVPFMCL